MTTELNGNNCEFENVSVIKSRAVNYLLTQLRNKETQAKVILFNVFQTGFLLIIFRFMCGTF